MQAVLQAEEFTLHAKEVSSFLQLVVVEPAGRLAVLVPSHNKANMLGVDMGRREAMAMVVEVRDIICETLEAEIELMKTPDYSLSST